jgi:hypothetical protein
VTEVTRNGAVLKGFDLRGSIDVFANNVTIEDCRITTTNWWGINQRAGYHGLRVLRCTIAGIPGKGIDRGGVDYGIADSGGYVEAARDNIAHVGEGISTGTGYFHDNFVHALESFIPHGSNLPEHTDAFISTGGSALVIRHNTLLNWMPPKRGGSAALLLNDALGTITNAKVDDNWIAGGSYGLYPGGGPSSRGVVITGNYFSTEFFPSCGYYGADATPYWHTGKGNAWANNIWANGHRFGRPVKP